MLIEASKTPYDRIRALQEETGGCPKKGKS